MKHGITCDDWMAHLDGALDAAAAARIRAHIARCEECAGTWDNLLRATEALRDAVREYELATPVGAAATRHGRDRVLARIRALDECGPGELSLARLRRLQQVVAPVCGAQTAFRLIVESVARTPVRRGTTDWNTFLRELGGITSAVCGRSISRLVLHIGASLG